MKIWRHFNVGAGIFRKYTKNWSFNSPAATITEFTTCKATTKVQKNKKECADCQLCKSVFCSEKGCIETFTDFWQQDNHMLQGLHKIPKTTTSFD